MVMWKLCKMCGTASAMQSNMISTGHRSTVIHDQHELPYWITEQQSVYKVTHVYQLKINK